MLISAFTLLLSVTDGLCSVSVARYSTLQSEVQRLKDKEQGYQSETQRLQQAVISLEKVRVTYSHVYCLCSTLCSKLPCAGFVYL